MGLIYLDSCLVIYAFEDDARWGLPVKAAMAAAAPSEFAISPLVRFECLVGPMRSGNLQLQRHYEEGLRQFRQLAMPDAVYVLGATLRARHGLKPPDALHLATAQWHRCDALWTHDTRLGRAAHGLAMDILHAAL